MSGIPSDQVLAILRLKQWAADRVALRNARATQLRHTGWRERRTREADARQVRVLARDERLFCPLIPKANSDPSSLRSSG